MPMWTSLNMQNGNSPIMEFLIFFHDNVMILIIMLMTNLLLMFIFMFLMKIFTLKFSENQSMEDLWLIIPIIFLIFIGFPSIKNLYMCEEIFECDLNVKISGFQWYWSYEISNCSFDSILMQEKYLFRLIETFNNLIIPLKSSIHLFISSNDVIHSWTIPSIGVKTDAIPGRISQNIMLINRPGVLIGQCSEICGSNHSFMPIVVSVSSFNKI